MNKALFGKTVAVMVANGFLEKDLTMMQKAMMDVGGHLKIISIESGLVNSWNGEGWGLNFASDSPLNRSLAADFDMLVVPGGMRGLQKLTQTAHTKRFMNGFIDSGKRVVLFDDALRLLAHAERAQGVAVAGPDSACEMLEEAGAVWNDAAYIAHDALLSGVCDDDTREAFINVVISFLKGQDVCPLLDQAA